MYTLYSIQLLYIYTNEHYIPRSMSLPFFFIPATVPAGPCSFAASLMERFKVWRMDLQQLGFCEQIMAGKFKWALYKKCREKKTHVMGGDMWKKHFCTFGVLNQCYRISKIFGWCKLKQKLEAWVSNLWVTSKLTQKQVGHPKKCQCDKRLISKLEVSLGQKDLWFLTWHVWHLFCAPHSAA